MKKAKARHLSGWLIFFQCEIMEKQRVIVYIDGFNFYYGLKDSRWKQYYWLDVVKLFEKFMRPDQELVAVKYFSARPTNDPGKNTRQYAFFQANKENPKFQLIPPNHYSSNLAALANGSPIMLARYESRFRQSLLPDTVHLSAQNFDLTIPPKWKSFQPQH